MTEPITDPPAGPTVEPSAAEPPKDAPAGDKRAILADLARERDKRQELERRVESLAPLQKLAEMLGAGTPEADGKSEVELLSERFAQHERALAEERLARWRAEVAAEKQLPPALSARLQGSTREELVADADALRALLPADGPRNPAPDPSQGARAPVDIDALIREAEANGNIREAIRLKNAKLHT